MKKLTIITVMLAAMFCGAMSEVSAQSGISAKVFQTQGNNVNSLYTGSNPLSWAEGDINKDGVKDLVIVEKSNGKNMAVYWGVSGGYKLFHSYENLDDKDSIWVSINDKGVIRIETSYEAVCEQPSEYEEGVIYYSTWRDYCVYMFRWQDNDLYLIGGKIWGCDAFSDYADMDITGGHSFNTLTFKAVDVYYNIKTGKPDKEMKVYNYDLSPKIIHKISDIKIGNYGFDDYTLTKINN